MIMNKRIKWFMVVFIGGFTWLHAQTFPGDAVVLLSKAGNSYQGIIDISSPEGLYLNLDDGRYLPFYTHEIESVRLLADKNDKLRLAATAEVAMQNQDRKEWDKDHAIHKPLPKFLQSDSKSNKVSVAQKKSPEMNSLGISVASNVVSHTIMDISPRDEEEIIQDYAFTDEVEEIRLINQERRKRMKY